MRASVLLSWVCVCVDSGIPTACLLFSREIDDITTKSHSSELRFHVLPFCILCFDTFLCTTRVAFIEVQFEDIVSILRIGKL